MSSPNVADGKEDIFSWTFYPVQASLSVLVACIFPELRPPPPPPRQGRPPKKHGLDRVKNVLLKLFLAGLQPKAFLELPVHRLYNNVMYLCQQFSYYAIWYLIIVLLYSTI